ncbi:MAG: DinB family protein, partial [Planctomycetota bacterium]
IEPEGFDQPLSDAWTVKEMLAHLAFWEETSLPVINTIFRGGAEVPVDQWYGGADLELAPDAPWPDADTHNEREARWARRRTTDEVIERLRQARENLKTVIATVTDEEGRGPIGEHWSAEAICRHVDEHLAQIEASGALPPATSK